MKKNLIEKRLAELSQDLATASTALSTQEETVKEIRIKVHRMQGAQMILKEILAAIKKEEEETTVPNSV